MIIFDGLDEVLDKRMICFDKELYYLFFLNDIRCDRLILKSLFFILFDL